MKSYEKIKNSPHFGAHSDIIADVLELFNYLLNYQQTSYKPSVFCLYLFKQISFQPTATTKATEWLWL